MQQVRHTFGGRMSAVSGTERVVHIHFRQRCQFLGEFGVVLFLFLMEADVLQQHHFAVLQFGGQLVGGFADHVVRHLHFLTQQLAQTLGDGAQRILHVELSLGTAQMRAQNDFRAILDQILNGGKRAAEAVLIGDHFVFVHGHVEITAYQYLFSVDLNVFNGLLRHNQHSLADENFYCKAVFRRANIPFRAAPESPWPRPRPLPASDGASPA